MNGRKIKWAHMADEPFLSRKGYRKKLRHSTTSLQMEPQLPAIPEFPRDSLAVDDVTGAK